MSDGRGAELAADAGLARQAHAEGGHAYCGVDCEVEFPTEELRHAVLYKGVPGSAGMLDELLRRAAAEGARLHASRMFRVHLRDREVLVKACRELVSGQDVAERLERILAVLEELRPNPDEEEEEGE